MGQPMAIDRDVNRIEINQELSPNLFYSPTSSRRPGGITLLDEIKARGYNPASYHGPELRTT
jgi:hypothetical protein